MREQKPRVSAQEPSGRAGPARRSKTDENYGQPTHEQISQRAYGIYLSRGSAGDAEADRLQAEHELAGRE